MVRSQVLVKARRPKDLRVVCRILNYIFLMPMSVREDQNHPVSDLKASRLFFVKNIHDSERASRSSRAKLVELSLRYICSQMSVHVLKLQAGIPLPCVLFQYLPMQCVLSTRSCCHPRGFSSVESCRHECHKVPYPSMPMCPLKKLPAWANQSRSTTPARFTRGLANDEVYTICCESSDSLTVLSARSDSYGLK